MTSITQVYCQFQVEAWHKWHNAPAVFGYLANAHRHLFHFKVAIRVDHDNREIEFIELKHILQADMQEYMQSSPEQPLLYSCEMLAKFALKAVQDRYSEADCSADVSEDGENGAIVVYVADDTALMLRML
jgi:hypothetical protein